jgi:hypothetical protein
MVYEINHFKFSNLAINVIMSSDSLMYACILSYRGMLPDNPPQLALHAAPPCIFLSNILYAYGNHRNK